MQRRSWRTRRSAAKQLQPLPSSRTAQLSHVASQPDAGHAARAASLRNHGARGGQHVDACGLGLNPGPCPSRPSAAGALGFTAATVSDTVVQTRAPAARPSIASLLASDTALCRGRGSGASSLAGSIATSGQVLRRDERRRMLAEAISDVQRNRHRRDPWRHLPLCLSALGQVRRFAPWPLDWI